MTRVPGLYDDVYMDLTFVEVMEREGINAPAASLAAGCFGVAKGGRIGGNRWSPRDSLVFVTTSGT